MTRYLKKAPKRKYKDKNKQSGQKKEKTGKNRGIQEHNTNYKKLLYPYMREFVHETRTRIDKNRMTE